MEEVFEMGLQQRMRTVAAVLAGMVIGVFGVSTLSAASEAGRPGATHSCESDRGSSMGLPQRTLWYGRVAHSAE